MNSDGREVALAKQLVQLHSAGDRLDENDDLRDTVGEKAVSKTRAETQELGVDRIFTQCWTAKPVRDQLTCTRAR